MPEFRKIEGPKLYDADIIFNPPNWSDLAQTQRKLFRLESLQMISDRLRNEFHYGHQSGREMPEISQTDWTTRLLDSYVGVPIGYDLPCLLSADRPTSRKIMLCAQDPLRGSGPAKLTVGTFFGLDSSYHRTRRHWGMIWKLIRTCVHAGYDVWVTDAIKLFAGKDVVNRDSALRELCLSTVCDEVAAFQPDKIIAFGAMAESALNAANVNAEVVRVPHPTARGIRGPLTERLEHYRRLILK